MNTFPQHQSGFQHNQEPTPVSGGSNEVRTPPHISATLASAEHRWKQTDIKTDSLDAVRDRLYARGATESDLGYTDLTKHQQHTPAITPPREAWAPTNEHIPTTPFTPPTVPLVVTQQRMRRRNKIRTVLFSGGAIFFVVAAILASAHVFYGRNLISNENISLEARGPFTVAGGDTYNFNIALTNQNTVPIDQATLIITYPNGSESTTESGKKILGDRKQLNRINSGEVMNIPVSVVIFGEENEEKTIQVTMDYRVEGSNATFVRSAPPLKLKVSSSPVTLIVESIRNIAAGQETVLTLTLTSNSPSPLEGLLVKAEYPNGFSYSSAEPKPSAGEDAWRITTLKPKESKKITIRGLMSGQNSETRVFRFNAGVAKEQDPFMLSSTFTTKTEEISLEAPFVNLGMKVNGKNDAIAILSPDETASADVSFRNTLADTIYDAEVQVVLEGNALNERTVNAGTGFYDSSKNTITWTAVETSGLQKIAPGESFSVTFSFEPTSLTPARSPQVKATVSVKGKRVSESSVSQALTSALTRTIKIDTTMGVATQVFHSTGPFKNSGPLPPIAEDETTYTVITAVTNGSNAVSDAVLEATLPPYIIWKDETNTKDGKVTYNASNRTLTWTIGDIEAGKTIAAAFKVGIKPSVSQVGTVPALAFEQRLRAKDRFTGTTIRASGPDVTTELRDESDESKQEGRVRLNGE
jgi:hypothetical protein